MLPPAIFLMGPTASGKTALAIELVQRYPCEIISVDSALIYKSMDIGSAKPDSATLKIAPHRLINLIDPAESYSAAQFRQDALQAMAEITAAGKVPLLVGGTMMYFKFLQDGAAQLPSSQASVRDAIMQQGAELGWPQLHAQLAQIDPQAAARLAPNDSQRIARALEVFELSGKTLTAHWQEQEIQPLPYRVVNLAVAPKERSVLHQRIELRFQQMLEQGFLDEVRKLHARPDLHADLPAIRCVGYRQAWDYLDGKYNYTEMVERGIIATRQLAKRQITWLRSWPELYWLDSLDPNLLQSALKILATHTIFNELNPT